MDYQEILNEMTDDEDFAEVVNVVMVKARNFRPRVNHFEKWDDIEFKQRFRISKPVARYIINKISPVVISLTRRNHSLTAEQMVLATLRFLATGSMLYVIGDLNGIHKATASRVIAKVIHHIALLYAEFIEMPSTPEELTEVKQGFYNIARFPRCIGALECSHIKIKNPGGDDAELYRNRKDFFSFNVQAVCDANLVFRNIVSRWPGSSHDSTIFRNSRIRADLEAGEYGEDSLILGDSGYALKNYLITPLAHPVTNAEHLFNEAQIRSRNPIERCFGVWKRRFPILALGIRMDIAKVEAIVIATAVIHNIARHMGDDVPVITDEEEAAIELTNNVNIYVGVGANGNENSLTRQLLITEHFQRLVNEH